MSGRANLFSLSGSAYRDITVLFYLQACLSVTSLGNAKVSFNNERVHIFTTFQHISL